MLINKYILLILKILKTLYKIYKFILFCEDCKDGFFEKDEECFPCKYPCINCRGDGDNHCISKYNIILNKRKLKTYNRKIICILILIYFEACGYGEENRVTPYSYRESY